MTHKLSVLKNVVILSTAVLLLIAVMGLTNLNQQSSTSQAAQITSFGKGETSKSSYVPSDSLPDLKPENMQITLEKWIPCMSNTNLGVRVWFSNIGEADAGPFVVVVNGKTQAVSGLPKGESSSLWFVGYSNPSTAIIDFTNTVIESDETNNQLIQPLPIPTLPAVPFCHISYLPIVIKD
jgi:hypothetical protein